MVLLGVVGDGPEICSFVLQVELLTSDLATVFIFISSSYLFPGPFGSEPIPTAIRSGVDIRTLA